MESIHRCHDGGPPCNATGAIGSNRVSWVRVAWNRVVGVRGGEVRCESEFTDSIQGGATGSPVARQKPQ